MRVYLLRRALQAVPLLLVISLLVFLLIHAALDGWADTVTVLTLGLSLVLIATFLSIESRTPQPLMPLRLFRDRNRNASYIVMLATGCGRAHREHISLPQPLFFGHGPRYHRPAYGPAVARRRPIGSLARPACLG